MRGARAITAALIALAGCSGSGHARDAATGTKVDAARDAAAPCRVTHPNGRAAPGESPSVGSYGNQGLWTVLPPDGVLRITTTRPVPPGDTFGQISPAGALSTKFPWFGSTAAHPTLTILGTRLDGRARPLHLRVGPGATANSPHFWATRLRFSTAGCWRVTAKSGPALLTFTLSVKRARLAPSRAPTGANTGRPPAAAGRARTIATCRNGKNGDHEAEFGVPASHVGDTRHPRCAQRSSGAFNKRA